MPIIRFLYSITLYTQVGGGIVKNYKITINKNDVTSLSSIKKALLQELLKQDNKLDTVLIEVNKDFFTPTNWTGEEEQMVDRALSIYGALTHIIVMTNNVYTSISTYVHSEQVVTLMLGKAKLPLSYNQPHSLDMLKDLVEHRVTLCSLIETYRNHSSMKTSKLSSSIIELLTQSITSSEKPLQGLVTVFVYDDKIVVSFTNNLERFVSSILSISDESKLSVVEDCPINISSEGQKPYIVYIYGLKASCPYKLGSASSLTVNDFLNLNKDSHVIPLQTTHIGNNSHHTLLTLLSQYTNAGEFSYINSNPLD